ncbi:MAG: glycosyltransferase [FCB group bacterium]|nr:glycosyltransferase [FCB group bacterium]
MKSVLIIAYYFPPLGGSGVQRTLKFVKYLQEFNYRPIVLSPNPKLIRHLVHDYTLVDEIPKETKIYNTFILDLNWIFKILYGFKLKKVVNFLNGNLLFPDYQIQWIPFAKLKIKKIMKKEKIDIVYITSPPYSTQLLGNWIKSRYNLPIVSDFRDPFTFNFQKKKEIFFRKCFDLEEKLLTNTDYIIANTSLNKKKYIEEFNINQKKITIITNGFDNEDFSTNEIINKTPNKPIIFSHIGQFYGEYNAKPFLNAINKIKNKIEHIEFRFIGKITPNDKKIIKKYKLTNIKLIDYCSHQRAMQYNKESDFLVLILANEEWDYWIPGKTYEYINSNKKILAVVPENGSCAEIIRNTKTGVVVSPNSIDKIANVILELIENHNKDNFNPDFEEIQKYERRNLTKKLANIFYKVLEDKYSNIERDEIIN